MSGESSSYDGEPLVESRPANRNSFDILSKVVSNIFPENKRYPITSLYILNPTERNYFGAQDYSGVEATRVVELMHDLSRSRELVERYPMLLQPAIDHATKNIPHDLISEKSSLLLDIRRNFAHEVRLGNKLLWPYRVMARIEIAESQGVDVKENITLIAKKKLENKLETITRLHDIKQRTDFLLTAATVMKPDSLQCLLENYSPSAIINILNPNNPKGWLRCVEPINLTAEDKGHRFKGTSFPTVEEINQLVSCVGRSGTAYLLQFPVLTARFINTIDKRSTEITPVLKHNLSIVLEKYEELLISPALTRRRDEDFYSQEYFWNDLLRIAQCVDSSGEIPSSKQQEILNLHKELEKDFGINNEVYPLPVELSIRPDIAGITILENLRWAQRAFNLGSRNAAISESLRLAGRERFSDQVWAELEYIRWIQENPIAILSARYSTENNEQLKTPELSMDLLSSVFSPIGDYQPTIGVEIQNIPADKILSNKVGATITQNSLEKISQLRELGLTFDEHGGITPADTASGVEICLPPSLSQTQTLKLFDLLTDIGFTETIVVNPQTYAVNTQFGETIHITYGVRAGLETVRKDNGEIVQRIPREFRMARHLLDFTADGTLPDRFVLQKIINDIKSEPDLNVAQNKIREFLEDPLKFFLDVSKIASPAEIAAAFSSINHSLGEIEDVSSRSINQGAGWRMSETPTIPSPRIDENRQYYQMRLLENRHPYTTRRLISNSYATWSCFDELSVLRQESDDQTLQQLEVLTDSIMKSSWEDVDKIADEVAQKLTISRQYENEFLRMHSNTLVKNALKLAYVGQNLESIFNIPMSQAWEINNTMLDNKLKAEINNAFVLGAPEIDTEYAFMYSLVMNYAEKRAPAAGGYGLKITFEDGSTKTLKDYYQIPKNDRSRRYQQWRGSKNPLYRLSTDRWMLERMDVPYIFGINVETNKPEYVHLVKSGVERGNRLAMKNEAVAKTEFAFNSIKPEWQEKWRQLLDNKEFRTKNPATRFRERLKTAFLVGLSHDSYIDLMLGEEREINRTLTPTIIGGKQFNSPTDAIQSMMADVQADIDNSERMVEEAIKNEARGIHKEDDIRQFNSRWFTRRAKTNSISDNQYFTSIQDNKYV